jgi:hypothetical protein
MKNNALLSLMFVAVLAALGLGGLHGAAGASLVAGILLILSLDYTPLPRPVLTDPVSARPAPAGGAAGRNRTNGGRLPGWTPSGGLQRRLVDGPVY